MTPSPGPEPRIAESRLEANGLDHHVVEWTPAATPPIATFVLCHGFLDFAWAWRDVGDGLARAGYRAVAFDWRGHGETDWVGAGGYYHFPDYVRDLDLLLPQLVSEFERLHLVGHSMGGTAASLFASVRGPSRVATLALLEGIGPPPTDPETAPRRLRSFLDGTRREANRRHKPLASIEDALRRMRIRNPELPDDPGRFLAEKATRQADDGEGRVWRFDPMHRTTNPNPIPVRGYIACLEEIAMPTLLLRGEKGLEWPNEEGRVAALPDVRVEVLPGVGHMMHWQAPDAVVGHLVRHAGSHPA